MPESADFTNHQVGGYRLVQRINIGGFSSIWRGREADRPESEAAIKIMRPHAAQSSEARQMFRHEWKIARRFEHARLLLYYGYGTHRSLPYVTMEYFPGKSLRRLLTDDAGAVRGAAPAIISQVAEALQYIHTLGVVHCDLKPENVLIGKGRQVRLIDFSIAQTRWQRRLSVSRKIHGTPAYLSPEQLRRERITPRSDLYSLGVICFEVLAGRALFTGRDAKAVMQQHVATTPPRLSLLNPQVSTAMDRLVADLLAKDPNLRPRSAREVLRRLSSADMYILA